MGGAQPLAVTMNGGVALCVEVDPARIERRIKTRLPRPRERRPRRGAAVGGRGACGTRGASRSGSSATAPRCCPSCSARGFAPDLVTDQTSAHDPLGGYVPAGLSLEEAERLRDDDPAGYERRSFDVDGPARRGDGRLPRRAARWCSTTGTTCGPAPRPAGSRTSARTPTRGSCRRSSGRCSARARARSAGWRSRATPRTSRRPTARSPSSSRRTSGCTAGSRWPRSGSRSRGCRRGSAGSATASGRRRACGSTRWSRAASSRRRS